MADDNILPFRAGQMPFRHDELEADISDIEARYGSNLYSNFLKRYGTRPDQKQAAVIGLLLDARVRACDGTLQPSENIKKSNKNYSAPELKAERRLEKNIGKLISAINNLSEIADSDPEKIIDKCCPHLDVPDVHAHLRIAVDWLSRFDEEWDRREKCRNVELKGSGS